MVFRFVHPRMATIASANQMFAAMKYRVININMVLTPNEKS